MIRSFIVGFVWILFLMWIGFLAVTVKDLTDYLSPVPQPPFSLDMGKLEVQKRFLALKGFALPEGIQRWTVGKRAEIAFRAPQPLERPFDLWLIVSPLVSPGKIQNLRFFFNGCLLQEVSYTTPKPYDSVYLATAAFVRDKNRLVLEISNPISPKALDPQSVDIRKLGVAFHRLVFVPSQGLAKTRGWENRGTP